MDNMLSPYECQFTVEERKRIIAQVLENVRKNKKYTQKEVAAFIGVKPTTYNTYESGRTEPPAEILVRLSYLYKVPVDTLIQRDRLFRGNLDIQKQLEEHQKKIRMMEEQLAENNGDNPMAKAMLEAMKQLATSMQEMSQKTELVQQAESTLDE